MPRGSRSSGGFRSSPRPRPVAAPARSPPPQTVNRAPPPATAQASNGGGSMLGNIGSTIVEGIGFGTGSSIAHRAVDFVMGPRTFRTETVVSETASAASPVANTKGSSGSCDIHSKVFQDCVNKFGSDISKCQYYMDMLSQCKKSSGSVMAA